MNDNTNFKTMLNMIWDMQNPVITVEFFDEKLFGDRWSITHHIIIPNGKDKVIDFCFVDGSKNNYLYSVKPLDMSFEEAMIVFGKMALRSQGAKLTLTTV